MDSLSSSRRVYPPVNWRLNVGITEPTPTVRVPLDKAEPWTDPEVSEEQDDFRGFHVFIILEMYYMSALFVWSLITVTVSALRHPPQTNGKTYVQRKPQQTENSKRLQTETKEHVTERTPPSRTLQSG